MRCPKCNNKLLQKSGTTTRLRTKGIHTFDENGNCSAQCYWCGEKVDVPVKVIEGTPIPSETFYVKGKA